MYDTNEESERVLRVAHREMGADGVVVLELRSPTGDDLPQWSPGAHVDLVLGPDRIRRQYSLCGDPADRRVWRLGVLREPAGRGGSDHVHRALQENALVRVCGPRNHFPLVASPRYLFIAGGIGITPLIPMLQAARGAGADVELHYGGRTRNTMAFRRQLVEDHGPAVTLYPEDEVGLIDLDLLLARPRTDTLVYSCGPGPLLDAVETRCAGWPAGTLHVERFAARTSTATVHDDEFEVEFAQSGLTLTVPAEMSILDVARAAGVDVESSCAEGICGTCETAVLRGRIDHRDSLLTREEQAANDTIYICVSRALDRRLVLDR